MCVKLGFEDYSVASMPQTAQPESSESHSNGGDKKKKKSKKGVVASNDPHSEATTLGVAAEEPPMPGETSFVDKVNKEFTTLSTLSTLVLFPFVQWLLFSALLFSPLNSLVLNHVGVYRLFYYSRWCGVGSL